LSGDGKDTCVGIIVIVCFYDLLCLATPVISPVNLSNKSLPINEHLHNNYTIKSCVSTLKSASFAVYEIAAKTTNMPGNSKRITSKRSTSTLAYFLCMSLLLTAWGIIVSQMIRSREEKNTTKFPTFVLLYTRKPESLIRSLVNKIDEIRVFCETHKPHVLCLNETWLDTSISDGEIQLDVYSHIRRDKTRHQGGVLVYISSNLNFKERNEIGDKSGELQCLWLEIVPPKSKGFLICSSYRPLNSDNERIYVEGLRNMLDNVSDLQKEVILIGDFNFDLKRSRKSAACKCFVDMSKEFGLKQIICDDTRVTQHSKSLIDLFLTSRPDLYITGVMPVGFSDQSVIYAIAFVEDLNKFPWSQIDITGDIEDSWNTFKNLFNDVADSHAPQIHVRTRGEKVPWLTTEIRKLMKERDNLHKLALKTNSELYWSSFKRMCNAVTLKLRREKKHYYNNQFQENESNPKGTWKNLKRLLGKCGKGTGCTGTDSATTDLKVKCNMFNRFFVSCATNLRSICSTTGHAFKKWLPQMEHSESFTFQQFTDSEVRTALRELKVKKATVQQCKIPGEWKKAKVTPLYKNSAKSDPKNFRPISVLPSGFRKKHSTETAVTHFADQILMGMDKGLVTGAVFIDLAEAFDTIDHDVLIHKLKHYGVSNESLLWFKDYLCAGKQFVTIDSHRSEELDIACGVPQGSIIGPLLFIIYINDLLFCMRSCSVSMYADDTAIYFAASTVDVRHGGVVFDNHMTWKDQADHVYKKVAVRVNILRRIRTFLTEKAAIHVYNAFCNKTRTDYSDCNIAPRSYHKAILVYKCLHSLVPNYFVNYFKKFSNVHSYNTRHKN
ncbi:Hypothetical predicted protein, partial [Paramuricea clavata]